VNSSSVYAEHQVWTPEMCGTVIGAALSQKEHSGTVEQDGAKGERLDIRSCSRYFIDSVIYPEIVGDVWNACRRYNIWGFDIKQLPSIEVLRYRPADFYTKHTDWGGTYTQRKISTSIQLSSPDDYEGGEINLHVGPEDIEVSKEQGVGTMWPSWSLHSVNPVTDGERWCAVGWVLGPLFR